MAESAVSIRGLCYQYPGVPALSGLDLDLQEGVFCALVGQNGSGKTTLAKHLNGLLKPVSGTVRVFGRDTQSLTVGQLARDVGYVFQNPDHQIFSGSVREELAFGPRNLGLQECDIARRVADALQVFGLESLADRPPATLGFGLRRLVGVAAVYAMRPRLFVLDEPTAELDWRSAHELLSCFRALSGQGHTVLLISHDMELVAEYAQRVLLLHQGQIIADGPPETFFAQHELLGRTGLTPPQAAGLAARLSDIGMPAESPTVEAFVRAYAGLLSARDADAR